MFPKLTRAAGVALRALAGQERAVANARAAATHLSRCRVEREEAAMAVAAAVERRRARTAWPPVA
jgi:hypothetical protein